MREIKIDSYNEGDKKHEREREGQTDRQKR